MKKIVLTLLVILLLFLGALWALPFFFKGHILEAIKKGANENLKAQLEFSDVRLSFFRSFPDLSVSIKNLSLSGLDTFSRDTLMQTASLDLTLNFWKLWNQEYAVENLHLEQPRIYLHVLRDGSANWDIVPEGSAATEESAESSTPFELALKKYGINRGYLKYWDEELDFSLIMQDLTHNGSGNFKLDSFTLETYTLSESLTMTYEGVPWLYKVRTEMVVPLEMDLNRFIFRIKEARNISLNKLKLGFDGYIALPDSGIEMDFTFDAAQSEFKNFLSLIPAVYSEDFDKMSASGKFGFNGFVRGLYSDNGIPGFGLTLQVEDGAFRYPDLPQGISNTRVHLNITNPSGDPDATVVDLKEFHLESGKDPFDARLLLKTPVSDPDFDFEFKGVVNLTELARSLPLEKGTVLEGMLQTSLAAKGRYSSVEKGAYGAVEASGTLNMQDLVYAVPGENPTKVPVFRFAITPRYMELTRAEVRLDQSDITAMGRLENYLGYFLKDQTLKGQLSVQSGFLDLNPFMVSEEGGTTASASDTSAPMSPPEIPSNLDISISTQAARILYDNLSLENFKGRILLREGSLFIQEAGVQLLEGMVQMKGVYHSPLNGRTPSMEMALNIQGMNIPKAVESFPSLEKMAPPAKYTKGYFSSALNFNTQLDGEMQPVYPSLFGGGSLELLQARIENYPPLEKLSSALKMNEFKSMDLGDMRIRFEFREGRVWTAPQTFSRYNVQIVAEGSSGFDQSLDYKLNMLVPRDKMGAEGARVVNDLVQKANAQGASLSMSQNVNLVAQMGGTVNQPEVKLNLKETLAGTGGDLKQAAKDILGAQKDKAQERLDREADSLKRLGEDKARQLEAEAKARAEEEKRKAEEAARKKAEEEKKRLEEEAKKKLKGVIKP